MGELEKAKDRGFRILDGRGRWKYYWRVWKGEMSGMKFEDVSVAFTCSVLAVDPSSDPRLLDLVLEVDAQTFLSAKSETKH